MKTLFYLMDIRTIDAQALPRLLEELPASRREKALAFRFEADRLRSVAAGLLARHALEQVGLSDELLCYEENGKPYIEGHPSRCLSLSHSGDYAACVLSPAPIAVDVEIHDGDRDTIVKRCYTEAEQAWVNAVQGQERTARFYEIWCKKECRMKLRDWNHLREIDTFTPDPGFAYRLFPLPGYGCAVYAKEELLPDSPVWYSCEGAIQG